MNTERTKLQQHLLEKVQGILGTTTAPGASVALLLDGELQLNSAVGFRDLEQTAALDSQALFYIYSTTKSLIATVILQLVEGGRITLDTPLQAYLPQVSLKASVTIRQLLNHTAGIPDYGSMAAYFEAVKATPAHSWTGDEFLAVTLPNGLTFTPGSAWGYSNIGFLLLRQVIEATLGVSLRRALDDYIFARLDLQQIFVAETLEEARQLTPGYSSFFEADGLLHDIRHIYHPGWVSHGVVIATAADLTRVFDAILSGELLGPQSRSAMLEAVDVPVKHPLFQQPAYGLGIMIDRESIYGVMAGHGGAGPGYSAGVLHLADVDGRRITGVALVNSDQGDLGLGLAFEMVMRAGDGLSGRDEAGQER